MRLRGQPSLVLQTGPAPEVIAELLRDAGCTVNYDAPNARPWHGLTKLTDQGVEELTARSLDRRHKLPPCAKLNPTT